MGDNALKRLPFIRKATLAVAREVSKAEADVIPDGFRNHIRWHLGHIVTTQDRFAFVFAGLPSRIPAGYDKWFGRDTTPLTWEGEGPSLEEIVSLLEQQPEQIREVHEGKLDARLDKPFTTSAGLTLETVGETLNYSMYHEGVHLGVIKTYLRLIRQK